METQNNFKYSSQLIIKFLKDELNAQEKKAFELWLSASPANRELLESFRNTATVQQEINYIDAVDTNKGWEEISKQIQAKPVKTFFWNKAMKYSTAALLFITIGVGIYYYASKNSNREFNSAQASQDIMPGSLKAVLQLADGSSLDLGSNKFSLRGENGDVALSAAKGTLYFGNNKGIRTKGYNLLRTPRAGEYKMVLSDGTKVWLNASSTLRFPADFNRAERRVQLTGEAYFEVAHNKRMPFRVSFNDTEVEVLGTHFNISTFGNQSRTTLIEGSVKVTEAGKQKLLKPGEEAVVNEGKVAIHKTDTYKSIAWKEGTFYFQDDLMTDIMDQVLRWYNVEIIYKGKPGNKRYSGNIRRQATLKQVLEMLNAVSGTKFSLEERTVTVDFNN